MPEIVRLPAPLRRRLEARVAERQRSWRSPGVSAGIMRRGTLVWSHHVGSARLVPPTPASDDTQFMIGSVTKTFTAVLVLKLRDEGRLGLDDLLGTFLPGTKHAGLTLRQLLAHSSGLQREPVGNLWETLQTPNAAELITGLESAEQVLPPYFLYHYSNLAYGLLGQVVERVTGGSWEQELSTRVLEPLGMTRTGLTPADDRALGYQVDPFAGIATEEPLFHPGATAPLGGLWSTVADMSRYAGFVAAPDPAVLSPDTLAEMCRPLVMTDLEAWTGAYGLGFGMARRGERVYVGHGGAMPGYLTGFRVRPQDGLGAIVFANSTAGAMSSVLALELLEDVLDAEPTVGMTWVPEEPQPDLAELLGPWWSEGEELVFEVRSGQLWSRLGGGDPLGDTRFERESPTRFRAAQGRERGEVLDLVRGPGGTLDRLYFATYPVTRRPHAFADLARRD